MPGRSAAALALLALALIAAWLATRDGEPRASTTRQRPGGASAIAGRTQADASTEASVKAGVARVPSRRLQGPPLPGPLPPDDAPLSATYAQLKSRGEAGDAAAAARLYHDLQQCFSAHQRVHSLPMQISFLEEYAPKPGSNLGEEMMKGREERLAGLKNELHDAERDAARCDGLSEEQLRLAPAALGAARLGDKAASDCYVSGFLLFAGGILDHPEWLAQYKENALTIANNALAAGDWSMVNELQHAYAPAGFRFGPLGDLVGENAAMSYRLLRLQRLGASAEMARAYDRQLAAAVRDLSPDAIAEGDAWAQDTFSKYFAGAQASPDDDRDTGCKL